jgi:hypothetical protein
MTTDEITRIQAILNSPEGQKNPEAAKRYAYETELSVKDALAAINQEGAAAMWRGVIAEKNKHIEGKF